MTCIKDACPAHIAICVANFYAMCSLKRTSEKYVKRYIKDVPQRKSHPRSELFMRFALYSTELLYC